MGGTTVLSCEGRAVGCIGCGYCCVKAPCYLGTPAVDAAESHWQGCPELVFDNGRHWCGVVLRAEREKARQLKQTLAIGEGCCSALNSWRWEPVRDRRPESSRRSE